MKMMIQFMEKVMKTLKGKYIATLTIMKYSK